MVDIPADQESGMQIWHSRARSHVFCSRSKITLRGLLSLGPTSLRVMRDTMSALVAVKKELVFHFFPMVSLLAAATCKTIVYILHHGAL